MSVTPIRKEDRKSDDMSKGSAEKNQALDAALAQIERAFGKGSIMKLNDEQQKNNVESISTGSLGLDTVLALVVFHADVSSKFTVQKAPGKQHLHFM